MEARHALLIGVPRCSNDEIFAPIPDDVIAKDMTRMGRALAQSGYQITVLGTPPAGDVPIRRWIEDSPTRSRCLDEIQAACNRVPADGTLLIYFSGHGVRIGGADYLVPQDVSSLGLDGKLQRSRLVPVNFSEEAALCQARTVLTIVDACRDRPADAATEPESGQSLPHLPTGSFVLVRGCGPGETCAWQEGQGSVFTRALAGALRRNESPRTLGQVLQATRDRLREQDSPQHPELVSVGAPAEILNTVVCDGIAMLDDWRTAITDCRLWTLAAETGQVEALRDAVRGVVSTFGRLVGEQRDRLAAKEDLGDPWTDDGYPGRVLDALFLLLTAPRGTRPMLPAVEVAALVAAPFLREAILARALYDVPELRPRDFRRHFGDGLRADLENVFANQEQLTRRAQGLAERLPEARDTLVMWLVDRWLLEREDVWESRTASSWATDLARSVLFVVENHPGEGRVGEFGQLLLVLARSIASVLGPGDTDSTIVRLRPLGHLLSVAGVLGGDPRRMGGIVADHVGTKDVVGPDQLRSTISDEVTWRWAGEELVVDAVCAHPAIHAALAGLAAEADAACGVARRAAAKMPENETELLAGVPLRCREELRPEKSKYGKPLLRFHLAGDRIRDLLMGTQLYGDAAIAIRELYQNALDACRYRHLRLRCELGTTTPPGWQGRIVLRQDIDEAGRRYIECTDTGVGMTEAVLNHTFTAAGTRFVHSEAFRREEARWRRVDPAYRLYPNSQFGIGVFSYFMLADEMSLWTAATAESGVGVVSSIHLHIPGHGGLFRLRRHDRMPEEIRAGGTTVRLYLFGNLEVSAARTLAAHLVHSEYDVQVWENGELVKRWRPDVPSYGTGKVEPRPGEDGFWWVAGPGRPLSDGIRVDNIGGRRVADKWFGRLVNLSGPRQPRLSVDRSTMLDWDKGWADRQSLASVPALAGWEGFDWPWLWSLAAQNLELTQEVFDTHLDRELALTGTPGTPVARIGTVGCLPYDNDLIRGVSNEVTTELPQLLRPWRRALWRQAAKGWSTAPKRERGEPEDLSGYPVLTPQDYLVLDWLVDARDPRESTHPFPLPDDPEEVLYRLRRLVLAGLDLRALREIHGGDHPLVPLAVVAWSHMSANVTPLQVRLFWLARHARLRFRQAWTMFHDYAAGRGVTLADPESTGHPDFMPGTGDLKWVSRDNDGTRPWQVRWSLRDIQQRADRTGETLDRIRERLETYGAWGFSSPALMSLDSPDPENKAAITLHSYVLDLDDLPTLYEVAHLAVQLGVPIRTAYDQLVAVAGPLGVRLDESIAERLPVDDVTEADDALLTRFGGDGHHDTIDWLVRDLRENFAGRPSSEATAVYVRNGFLFDLPTVVTHAHLVELACRLRASVGHAEMLARQVFTGWRELPAAGSIPEEAAAIRPTREEAAYLVDDQGWRPSTPASLAAFARVTTSTIGEALDRLAPYRKLGVTLPEVDDTLGAYSPDGCDDLALEMAVPAPDDALVTPLRLVRVAGRFGWTVRTAWDRLARFAPVGLRLLPARDQCPDSVVDWADVIVLSRHRDGWEPALTGRVTRTEMQRAADAVREPVDRTRSRLEHYAGLFEFTCEELP